MGITTKCCSGSYSRTDNDSSSKTEDSKIQEDKIELINKIPEVKDSDQGLNYICSNEANNIIVKIPRSIFVKKLCNEMPISEIYIFIKKIINWILSFQLKKNNLIIKKYISRIQIYTELGTKNILSELNNLLYEFKKEDEDMLLQSLSDWIMLAQLIISLDNNNSWIYKNLEKIFKNYIFDGCYFLSKIKIKCKYELKDTISLGKLIPTQIKVNPDTKNEIKKLVTLVEDFINELIESK